MDKKPSVLFVFLVILADPSEFVTDCLTSEGVNWYNNARYLKFVWQEAAHFCPEYSLFETCHSLEPSTK